MYRGEWVNSISHLIGAVLAVAGLVVLVVVAARQGDPWKIVSFSIYGTTLVLLYVFSTLYHSLPGKAKRVFQKLDHNAIYLLIAGTYTPFVLVPLRGSWGWSLFGVIWGLAFLGIAVEFVSGGSRRIVRIVIYLAMGWLVVIAARPLVQQLPSGCLALMAAGGLLYSGGVAFYAADKRLKHAHGVWHVFVIAASAAHYLAVLLYVAPPD